MTEIEQLRNRANDITYPKDETMVNPKKRIEGMAFFPGGSGMAGPDQVIRNKRIMILGQDQDNETGYEKSLKKRDETYSPTWTNLDKLLGEAGIKMEQCFFTNFLMGVRKSGRNTGPSPGLSDSNFLEACSEMLEEQLRKQRPAAILCLGDIPVRLLGLVSRRMLLATIGAQSIKDMDARKSQLLLDVVFDAVPDLRADVCILVHPSFRWLNVRRRRFENHRGESAELAMLKKITERLERSRKSEVVVET
jgi:uracil-DNA glycosylase